MNMAPVFDQPTLLRQNLLKSSLSLFLCPLRLANWVSAITTAFVLPLLLASCGGGGVAEPLAPPQVLRVESQALIAGFELRFDNATFAPSALGFDSLGGAVHQLQRPTLSGGGGMTLLVYLPGSVLMPATLESKPVPSSVAQGSTVRAARCADRQGNDVVCTARWVTPS